MLRHRPSGVGLGGANWLAERVIMGVECVRSKRRIWLRISPGSSRKRNGMVAGDSTNWTSGEFSKRVFDQLEAQLMPAFPKTRGNGLVDCLYEQGALTGETRSSISPVRQLLHANGYVQQHLSKS